MMNKEKFPFPVPDGGYNSLNMCSVVGTAAAMIGGSIIGGLISSDSARSAGNKQKDASIAASNASLQASREANALQQQQYQQNLALQSPQLQVGQQAQAALMQGLGLGGMTATQETQPTVDEYGNTVAGVKNYGATQEQLNRGTGSLQAGQFKQGLPTDFTKDPSYQFRLDQGLKALQASASARGGLLTGRAGTDITNYAGQAASQEYGAAFDRNRATQSDLYNRLASLAGLAPQTAAGLGQMGSQYANQAGGNIMQGVGQSQNYLTSGAVNQANAQMQGAAGFTGGINNAMGNWAYLQGRGGVGAGTPIVPTGPSNAQLEQMYFPG